MASRRQLRRGRLIGKPRLTRLGMGRLANLRPGPFPFARNGTTLNTMIYSEQSPHEWGGAGRWVMLLVLLALLIRLPLLPLPGHGYDLGFFVRWTDAVHRNGLSDVLDSTRVDYPAFPIILWPLAESYGPFVEQPAATDDTFYRLVKLPGVLGDLAVVAAIFLVSRRLFEQSTAGTRARLTLSGWLPLLRSIRIAAADRAALLAASLWAFNPAIIYDSAYWGQIDSLIALSMLGSVGAMLAGRPGLAGLALAAGFAVKPQPIVLAPVIAATVFQRFGLCGVMRALVGSAAGLALMLSYFVVNGQLADIVDIYVRIFGFREQLSYNAWNIWWPVEAFANPTPGDVVLSVAGVGLTYESLSVLLLFPATLAAVGFSLSRRDYFSLLLAASFTIFSVFMFATAVHERYLIYIFALLAPVALLDRRWLFVYCSLSTTVLLNLSASLPPYEPWGELVNGAGSSLALTSINAVLYVSVGSAILAGGPFSGRRRTTPSGADRASEANLDAIARAAPAGD